MRAVSRIGVKSRVNEFIEMLHRIGTAIGMEKLFRHVIGDTFAHLAITSPQS